MNPRIEASIGKPGIGKLAGPPSTVRETVDRASAWVDGSILGSLLYVNITVAVVEPARIAT